MPEMVTDRRNTGTKWLLRAEGLALLVLATAVYSQLPAPAAWWVFLVCFLLPDLSMLGYLAGPAPGAAIYNVFHTTIGPVLLVLAGLFAGLPFAIDASAIWLAHIGFDRMLGYGLKHRTGFKDTHLGHM